MKNFFKIMRRTRVFMALAIFAVLTAKFLDVYSEMPKAYYMSNPFGSQFGPSLLKMLATSSVAAGAAFITFTLLALVFGRAYCSFVCPFGTLMDIFRKTALLPAKIGFLKKTSLGKFVQKKILPLKFAGAHNIVRAIFLAIAAFSIASGYAFLFGFLDPYSLYGKIMGSVAHPAAAISVNGASRFLYGFEIYSVRPVNGHPEIALAAFGAALLILAAIFAASALRARLYCNTVCPVGSFLGIFAKFSLFKLSIDRKKCVACGLCARQCKAQCIDPKNKEVDFSRCVMCLDCFQSCNSGAFKFEVNDLYRKKKSAENKELGAKNAEFSASRRAFPKLALGLGSLFCLAAKKEGRGEGKNCRSENVGDDATPFKIDGARPDKRLPMPPGAGTMKNFTDHCTACQLCTAACRAHILKPSVGELGLTGFMQPFMDFTSGYCIHKCHDCSKVCPTGAIHFIKSDEKMHLKIGTAIFRKGLCVVHTDGTDCAACAEHCPVSAIEMLPYGRKELNLYIPHVHEDVCIGCGACEYICPVVPHKAIVVQGLKTQSKAKVFDNSMRLYCPEETKADKKGGDKPKVQTPPAQDFPF